MTREVESDCFYDMMLVSFYVSEIFEHTTTIRDGSSLDLSFSAGYEYPCIIHCTRQENHWLDGRGLLDCCIAGSSGLYVVCGFPAV